MITLPSPNHGPRPPDRPIDILVLHYTGMTSAMAALDRLCDPRSQVSAHYLIDEGGAVWTLVPEHRRAWHAGVSFWAGDRDVNGRSIGVELVNPGHEFGYRPFPEAQMEALADLCAGILRRHPIPPARVLGHSDVAIGRKIDPGELFDWPWLARRGIGLWPGIGQGGIPPAGPGAASFAEDLVRFGYEPRGAEAVMAFQRHFRPGRIDGAVDDECVAILAALLAELA